MALRISETIKVAYTTKITSNYGDFSTISDYNLLKNNYKNAQKNLLKKITPFQLEICTFKVTNFEFSVLIYQKCLFLKFYINTPGGLTRFLTSFLSIFPP